ncbi:DUF445 domain-containing protein [Aquabacterium sp. A7-Y]|uniref:DUF445 domain-containing protein n=1 Tax=Aquabacterium sp. A7-Y TaxID=1349605 RepID=UPI00223CDB0F|nr:DUF445 domain-containing protein [Aquabacterium sp. A7-Y]MCW7539790.1 DUF445 domain-containing protein [Aquabacterium sp. A7-Y]
MDVNAVKVRGLRRMKAISLGLLAAAALLFAVASSLEGRHPGWAYLAAFAEAAMIGAIADWFAVVALFRHPLGLPIPHTAIVPANKARIGANLASFICSNFLSTPQVLEKLRHFDPAGRLADWLAAPGHADQVGAYLKAAMRYGLDALDDDRVSRFIRATVLTRLEQLDVSHLAGQVLDVLTAQGRHQALLDEVLQQVASLIEDEAVQAKIAAVIAGEVRYLRYLGLDNLAGQVATGKIVAGVGRVIGEMGKDPAHPLRLRFDEYVAGFIEKLRQDPALRLRGEQIRDETLAHPALTDYLRGLWHELLAWLQSDLGREDSSVARRISAAARTLGSKLQADATMREWINNQVLQAAPEWIERYREDIRRYIVSRVEAWNTRELTDELERNIGRDLQFVRINGTLVGGLVGLGIHALTQWLRG